MAKYVDGFVLAVPKKNVKAYRNMARLGGKVWKEYGALEFIECMGDDVPEGKTTSFRRSVKLKKGEVVFFSWIVYKSKRDRDRVLKKVMADPRMNNPKFMGVFDMKRMIYGGFKPLVTM